MTQEERENQFARLVREEQARGVSRREFLRRGLAMGLSLPAVLNVLAACGEAPRVASEPTTTPEALPTATSIPPTATPEPPTPAPTVAPPTATPQPTPVPEPTRFAVIGDYGLAGEAEQAVADMIKGWNVDFIVTTGDNNYPFGSPDTLDRNVGQYYAEFIHPYKGEYGPGGTENRFWPVLGNHDWDPGHIDAYLEYFNLPGNGRYYTLLQGPVEFFMLNSFFTEPDGFRADSIQAQWLEQELRASSAPWKIVMMHHPPYSSGYHGSSSWMRWPYREWGADVVLTGHDHNYERLDVDGLTYIVNGLGGGARYAPGGETFAGSHAFFNANHGAMLIEATPAQITFQFIVRDGQVFDIHTMQHLSV